MAHRPATFLRFGGSSPDHLTRLPTPGDHRNPAHSQVMTALSVPLPLQAIAILVVIAGLIWVSRRFEPHWVSKDGSRFTAKVQHLDEAGQNQGYWREVKATIDGQSVRLLARGLGNRTINAAAVSDPRAMLRQAGAGKNAQRLVGRRIQPFARYEVDHRADTDTAGKAVFLLVGEMGSDYLALRVPAKSRAVQSLEGLITDA